jgi:transposase
VLDLLSFGAINSVAHILGVGWDLIKEIHKSKLSRTYKNIPLEGINYIGVDEFSISKGHEYMTIFTDLEAARIIHAVKGRAKEDIRPFLEKLRKRARSLKAVAMDMSGSYYHAVSETLPGVDIVFDHYHVSALANQSIDELRREQQKELDALGKQTLKGCRFLLLKNYDNLSVDHKERLHDLLCANEPLFTAHCMKEQLRLFWEQPDLESARHFLETWCKDAREVGIKTLAKLAKTLAGYRTGLLNYFKHRISNATTEGLNNKIKTLKRQAYGFRDMEYFKLRLYHLHAQRYSLAG